MYSGRMSSGLAERFTVSRHVCHFSSLGLVPCFVCFGGCFVLVRVLCSASREL